MSRWRAFLALPIIAALLVGCTSPKGSASKKASPRASSSPSASSAPASHDPEEEAKRQQERLTLGYTPEKPPPDGFVPANREADRNDLMLEVKFDPTCVEKGSSTTLTAKTNRPNIRVSFIGTMEDENGRAVEEDGRTDAKGFWSWTFKVGPDVPSRTFEMLGAATDEEGGEGNQILGNWYFVVADPGACKR